MCRNRASKYFYSFTSTITGSYARTTATSCGFNCSAKDSDDTCISTFVCIYCSRTSYSGIVFLSYGLQFSVTFQDDGAAIVVIEG